MEKRENTQEILKISAISTSNISQISSSGLDLAEWLEHLTTNAKVATVLGSILVYSDTVESEGR
jgi:hypothetical protein